MQITILHETNDILVLNKPAGLLVHGDGRSEEATLADWLVEHYPKLSEVGEPWTNDATEMIPRPGIVHRLDRETSGVMVVARTQESFEALKELFQNRKIKKTYRAFAYDKMKEEYGEIDRPIGKSSSDFRKWSAQRGSRGVQREAHTAWKLLGVAETNDGVFSYLELAPTTGRTHQLRVHLKAVHHPIVCDSLYAPKRPCVLGFSRLALHAHTLTLPSSFATGATFEAPLPSDFVYAESFVT